MPSQTRRAKQINVRVETQTYEMLSLLAEQDGRSVPEAARRLLEAGLQQSSGRAISGDDFPAHQLAELSSAAGAFDWLNDEPDIYGDSSGEPV